MTKRIPAVVLVVCLAVVLAGSCAPAAESGSRTLVRTWEWHARVDPSSGAEQKIEDPGKYRLTFKDDGTYEFRVDCNQGSGTYEADGKGAIRMEPGPITRAECGESSLSADMLNMMSAVQDYRLEESGKLLVMVWPAGGPEDLYR
jgi:heat shock protein HslJ